MEQFKTKIILNKKIAKDHYLLSFKTSTKPKPGQFFNIRINNSNKPFLRRPFGAHRIEKGKVFILYKVVGEATKVFSRKKKNNIVDVLGPLGNSFNTKKVKTAFLVAGGHGVAPLYGLAKELKKKKCKVHVFIGACAKKHIVCESEFKKLGTKVHIATDDGSKGYKGLVTNLLKKTLISLPKEAKIYACGPKPMLKATAKVAKESKVLAELSLEEYMACGIGTCLGCAVKTQNGYKMVCKDGPIFDSRDIVWQI